MNADRRAPEYKEADRQAAHQPVTSTPHCASGCHGTQCPLSVFGIGGAALAFLIIYLVYV